MGYRDHVGGYRGRKTGHDILKTVVVVLAVLAAVLIGITLLGSDSLMEKLAILSPQDPISQQEQQNVPVQPEPEIVPPEPVPEPEPIPEPEPEPEVMTAVELTLEEAVSIAAPRRMEEVGANSVILNMKPSDGTLGWVSQHPMAAEVSANSPVENVNDLLIALNEQGYHTIARFSCFRDEMLSVNKQYCILSNSGYRWQDFEKVNWTSPYSQQVQDYLISLMVELAQLGFEEILLEHCGYPPDGSGEMGWIRKGTSYDPERLDVTVAQFLEKAKAALQPYETTLSIRTTAEILLQDGLKTGLTPQVLDRWTDRIWLPQGEGENAPERILEQIQIKEISTRLVTIATELSEESQVPRGMFREE